MKARIAWLPGDGIGPEVLREARRVLEIIAGEHNHEFEFVEADIGGGGIERHRRPLPKTTQNNSLKSTARFFRPAGGSKKKQPPPREKRANNLPGPPKPRGPYAKT